MLRVEKMSQGIRYTFKMTTTIVWRTENYLKYFNTEKPYLFYKEEIQIHYQSKRNVSKTTSFTLFLRNLIFLSKQKNLIFLYGSTLFLF